MMLWAALSVIGAVLWAAAMAVLADHLQADRSTWAWMGALFGPLALVLVLRHRGRHRRRR